MKIIIVVFLLTLDIKVYYSPLYEKKQGIESLFRNIQYSFLIKVCWCIIWDQDGQIRSYVIKWYRVGESCNQVSKLLVQSPNIWKSGKHAIFFNTQKRKQQQQNGLNVLRICERMVSFHYSLERKINIIEHLSFGEEVQYWLDDRFRYWYLYHGRCA